MNDFDFRLMEDYVGVLAAETLDAFMRRVPDATGLRLLALLYDGKVLRCDLPQVFERDGRSVVRISRVAAVLAERFVLGEGLEAEVLPYQQTSVFLRLGPREVPLNPDDPGLLALDPDPRLGPRPQGDEPALELARLDWSSRSGVAALDPAWWPETARIASDARSMKAAERLAGRFPSPPPSLARVLKRIGRYSWDDALPPIIRVLEDRLRDDPDRLEALGRTADAEPPEAVKALLAAVEDGGRLPLPPRLDDDRLRLIRILDRRREERVHQGACWTHRCTFSGLADTGWWLGLLLRHGDDRGGRKVLVRVGNSRDILEAHLSLGEPRACAWIDRPGDIVVEVEDAVIEAAGAYRERIEPGTVPGRQRP